LFGGAISLGLLYGIFTLTFSSAFPWYVFFGIAAYTSVGLVYTLSGLYKLLTPGSWFVGTRNELLEFRHGVVYARPWKLFTGAVSVTGDHEHGSVELELCHAELQIGAPETVHLLLIQQPHVVQAACSKRIVTVLNSRQLL
jgi:hypothetical protein